MKEINFKSKDIIIIVIVSVLCITASYILLYIPKANQIEKLRKEAASLYGEIEIIEGLVSSVPNPKKEIGVLQERLQRLKEKATEKEQIPRIIQQLFQKTGELNIEVVGIKPRDDIPHGSLNMPIGVTKAYIEVNIRCPYSSLVTYIETLNNLPLLVTIEDLTIEKDPHGVSEILSVKLLLSTYVMA